MKELKKSKNAWLLAAVIVSVLFVAGIPGIILSAVNGMTFRMVLSIICVAGGFYATPMLWIAYGGKVSLERTLVAIEVDHLYTVQEIAGQRHINIKDAVGQINKLMDNRYLTGYIFDGAELKLNQNQKLSEIKNTVKCPSCGANVEFGGKQGRCPYCGFLVDNKK